MRRGRMRPVFRPDGVSFPGDQVTEGSGETPAEMSISEALLAAWMAGYHDRDAEIGRLRGLLHELLSFGLNSKIGVATDLFRRVTEELNRNDVSNA